MHLAAALQVPVVTGLRSHRSGAQRPVWHKKHCAGSPESITSHSRRSKQSQGLLRITTEQLSRRLENFWEVRRELGTDCAARARSTWLHLAVLFYG